MGTLSEARRSGDNNVEDRFGSGLEGRGGGGGGGGHFGGHNLGPLPDATNNNVDKGAQSTKPKHFLVAGYFQLSQWQNE